MTAVESPFAIGFDIGGTNLRAAVVGADGQIVDTAQVRSNRDETSMENTIVGMVDNLSSKYPVSAVGVAVAGFLDPTCSTIQFAPHLPWRDAPLKERLAERLAVPVILEHDANSAAWGEYRFGAAQDAGTWVLFAIGTGIGATLMHNGEIFRGSFGVAPELGHLPVVPNGRACACGKRGCLERYCSGTALAASARELIAAEPGRESVLTGISDFTGADVMAAARQGDEVAQAALDEFIHWLSVGLSMVSDIFDPELVVVGGGVAANADLFLPRATQQSRQLIVGAGHRRNAHVRPASLGAEAGIIGVADLAARAAQR